jgi:hypothetical protein
MNDVVEVRLDPLGLVCAIVYAAVVGYMVGKLSQAGESRKSRDREAIHNRLFELEKAAGFYDPPKPEVTPAPAPAAKK